MYEFLTGFSHPLIGIDHLLAMFAVGVIAVQNGGRMTWALPAVFVIAMILGGILGVNAFALPMVETSIALSVLVFGTMVALAKKLPHALAIITVALFAVFHGHAHGTEMVAANALVYITGFVASTALMHFGGAMAGRHAKKSLISLQFLKSSGTAISIAGLLLLLTH